MPHILNPLFSAATGAIASHLEKYHAAVWHAHCEARKKIANVTAAKKKEDFDTCEMENAEVRFYDVRSSKGIFLFSARYKLFPQNFWILMPPVLFLPDAPEPADYWMEAEQNEARLVAKGPAGKALVALAKRFYSVTGSQQ